MQDIAIESYYHHLHFLQAWELFVDYNKEVNGLSEETCCQMEMLPGGEQITALERWWLGLPGKAKVVRDLNTGKLLGFIVYIQNPTHLWVEALYITPEFRYNGACRAILASFPGAKKVRFILHKSRSRRDQNPMMFGLQHARRIGEGPKPHLDIWEFEINTSNNENMGVIRKVMGDTVNGN